MITDIAVPIARAGDRATVRVAVADPRRLIADALASLIAHGRHTTVVAAISGPPSPQALAAARPDVVLVGVGEDPGAAIALLDPLRARAPHAQVALVADAVTPRLVGCVLERGFGGLLLTSCPAQDLLGSILRIAGGHAVLPTDWQAQAARAGTDPVDALSERQLEVLRLLAEGCSYEQIGGQLFISANTVKFHVRSIFHRLGVHNRVAAVRALGRSAAGAA